MKDLGIKYDVVTYNIITSALMRSLHLIPPFLAQMKNDGIEPDEFTCSVIIDACSRTQHASNMEDLFPLMQDLLKKIRNHGITPTVQHYTSIINALGAANQIDKMMQFYDEMNQDGIGTNVVICGRILNHLRRSKRIDQIPNFLKQMKKAKIKPTTTHYVYIVQAYAKSNQLEGIVKFLQQMKKLRPGWKNTILKNFGEQNQIEDIIQFHNILNHAGIRSNISTYTTIINILAKLKQIDKIPAILEEMKRKRIKPDAQLSAMTETLLNNSEITQ